MDIRCERCRAEYRFKDDAIGPAGLTVRCSKCGHVFKVRRPASGSAVPAAEAGWTLRKRRTGDVYAVTDLAQLQRWVAERRAIRDDEASVAGGPWRRLAEIPELGAAFAVAQAAKRSAAAPGDATAPGARRDLAHTTSVFPGPGRPPAPMQTEIAYKVPEAPGGGSTEPAWAQAQAQAAADRGPALTPLFTPGEEDRPGLDRDPAFTEPEPTLRDLSGEPERGALPLTGSAPLTADPPALSALIDERPPPTRGTAPKRKRSPVARVIGTLAVLITLIAVGGVAVALLKPEWLDPLFASLVAGTTKKAPAPKPPDAPVPGTSVGTPNGPSGQGTPLGASRPSGDQTRTPSPSVPGTEEAAPTRSADGGAPAGSSPAPAPRAPSAAETPSGAAPGAVPSSAPAAVPGTPVEAPSAPSEVAAGATRPGGTPPALTPSEVHTPPADGDASASAVPSKPVPGTASAATAGTTNTAAKPVPGTGAGNAAPKPVPGTGGAGAGAAPLNPTGAVPGTAPKTALPGTPPPAADSETASALKAVAPAPPPTPAKPPPPKLTGVAAQLAQARSLRARGRAEAALDLYGQVLGKEPQNPDALAGRGLCYFDLGQTSKAEDAFKSALAADATNGDALLGLAETYRYDSRRDDALAYYEKYLEAHPRGPGASIARANIQALKE